MKPTRHGRRGPNTALMSINVPKPTKAELASMAAAKNRTLSAFTRTILNNYVRKSIAARRKVMSL